MLETIVRYLHDSLITFRLSSYPSMEHVPRAAQPIPKHAVLVDTQLVLVGDRLAVLCFASTDHPDLATLTNELQAAVIEATQDDLPEALKRFAAQPPPLGQLFGFSVIVDERVTQYASLVFMPFGESDYIEIPYDEFARQEQPRVESFTRAGELTAPRRDEAAAPAR